MHVGAARADADAAVFTSEQGPNRAGPRTLYLGLVLDEPFLTDVTGR